MRKRFPQQGHMAASSTEINGVNPKFLLCRFAVRLRLSNSGSYLYPPSPVIPTPLSRLSLSQLYAEG